MKFKVREIFLFLCALGALGLIPLFISKDEPIEISIPVLDQEKIEAQEEKEEQLSRKAAVQAKQRRMISCKVNEDCIIVDKDPCGCLIGPEGVTAINAAYTLDFNKQQAHQLTKTCPEGAPSSEKECSPSAQAVCLNHICKITY